MLLSMRAGDFGLGAQKMSDKVIAELVAAGEITAPEGDAPAPAALYKFKTPEDHDPLSAAAKITSGFVDQDLPDAAQFLRQTSGTNTSEKEILDNEEAFSQMASDIREHCSLVAHSVIVEGKKKKVPGPRIATQVAEALQTVLDVHHELEKNRQRLTRHLGGCDQGCLGRCFRLCRHC